MLRPILAGVLLALVPAAPALANRDAIIQDCADDGRLQGHYSPSQLRDARQNLPSDISEYTDCADVLRRAELPDRASSSSNGSGVPAGIGGGGGGSGTSGGALLTPSSPAETKKLRQVASGAQPVQVNGQQVVPGASGLTPQAPRNSLPWTLLAVLALIVVGGLGAAVVALRDSVPWQRMLPRRG